MERSFPRGCVRTKRTKPDYLWFSTASAGGSMRRANLRRGIRWQDASWGKINVREMQCQVEKRKRCVGCEGRLDRCSFASCLETIIDVMIIDELRCVANDASNKKRTNLLLWKMMEILYETWRRKLQRLHGIGTHPYFPTRSFFYHARHFIFAVSKFRSHVEVLLNDSTFFIYLDLISVWVL